MFHELNLKQDSGELAPEIRSKINRALRLKADIKLLEEELDTLKLDLLTHPGINWAKRSAISTDLGVVRYLNGRERVEYKSPGAIEVIQKMKETLIESGDLRLGRGDCFLSITPTGCAPSIEEKFTAVMLIPDPHEVETKNQTRRK